jgi:hypothetical protein
MQRSVAGQVAFRINGKFSARHTPSPFFIIIEELIRPGKRPA